MRLRRSLTAALALAGLLAVPLAPAAAQRAGLYDVRGTNPDGVPYVGVLELQQIGIVSWRLTWEVGGAAIEGLGMSSGDVFAVGYRLGNIPGMGIYSILPDGSMTGQWTALGSTAIGTETLTPR